MNYFLDTSVVVQVGLGRLAEIFSDSAFFITDTVWRELDGLKNKEDAAGKMAREFFRQIASSKNLADSPLTPVVRTRGKIIDGKVEKRSKLDNITMRLLEGRVRLGVVTPNITTFKKDATADEKIIRIAKSYKAQNACLLTLDNGFFGLAQNLAAQTYDINALREKLGLTQAKTAVVVEENCIACGGKFTLTREDVARITAKGKPLPRRCQECIARANAKRKPKKKAGCVAVLLLFLASVLLAFFALFFAN